MISLVVGYHGVDVGTAPQLTMPVAVDQFGSYTYEGGSYGDIEFPAEPQDHNAVDQFLGLKSGSEDTYSGGALPSPSTVTVSVMNGSGAYNQATTTSQSLQALGFHIGTIGDSPPVGQEAETVVYYASKTPAQLAAAQLVANSLSGAVIMAMDPAKVTAGSQVTVVTGTEFSVNAPPATTTTAPAGAATSGTTTPTTAGNSGNTGNSGAFQAPTPTVESLQPWDPRSCTASGGEGP
jgi:LytR cell envelope-related transcriptional attenuator